MSQSTPASTPSRSRRGALPETPSSVRSNTSTSSALDRTTLLERVETVDLEVHDLRRSIAAEREKRRTLTLRQREKSRSTSSALQLAYFTGEAGNDVKTVHERIRDKLRTMDDDALTSLLTASVKGWRG